MTTTDTIVNKIQAITEGEITTGNPAPVEQFKILEEAGLLQIVLPGNELDFNVPNTPRLLQLLKAVGRANLSVGRIYEGHINALFLIHLYADEQQKQKWFADAAAGCLFSVWNTQADNGIEITEREDNTFILSGKKTFASGAGMISRALITGNIQSPARKGWQMCIVEADKLPEHQIDKGSWKPMGMRSSISYTFSFSGYEASTTDLFGCPDNYYKQPYFSGGAIRFAAVQLGGAEALFNHTAAFLKSLHRTDDPFQSARLADMTIALGSGDLWIRQAAANWDAWHQNEACSSKLIAYANMVRTAVEGICLKVIELSTKCIGARGLQQPFLMERMVRDLQFYLRQPAPDASLVGVAKYVMQTDCGIESMWYDN